MAIRYEMASLFLAMSFSQAQATEVLGKTWPILEPDMLEDISKRLNRMEQSGELAKLQQQALDRSLQSMERPTPVAGLVKTTTPRTYYFDPSVRVPQDIYAPDGTRIARANDTINPLDYMPLTKHLIFFDQQDADQVELAKQLIQKYKGRVKPILVAGEPLTLTRQWQRQVYFDQGGIMIQRFGIRQVPALVSQDQRRLRIDELEVK